MNDMKLSLTEKVINLCLLILIGCLTLMVVLMSGRLVFELFETVQR